MMGDSSSSGMRGRLCVLPGAWRVEADCCLVSGFPYSGFVVVVSSNRVVVVVVVVGCIQESGPLQRLNGRVGIKASARVVRSRLRAVRSRLEAKNQRGKVRRPTVHMLS
jgi:hypothetical protein